MLKKRTTFVIGAGASCELGLPSGDKLKADISDSLSLTSNHAYRFADEMMIDAIRFRHSHLRTDDQQKIAMLANAAQLISRGLPFSPSIDNFLHTHQGDEFIISVGKASIARVILSAEKKSKLFPKYAYLNDKESMENRIPSIYANKELLTTWYLPLSRSLFSLVEKSNPRRAFEDVSFVIFNYDRCLEEFLWQSLQAHFFLSPAEASDVLAGVDFVHPYGSLGRLPWQEDDELGEVPFGATNKMDLFRIGENLRTFTESINENIAMQVRDCIAASQNVIFLGFGFLEQNLDLIRPRNRELNNAQKVYATAFDVKDTNFDIIRNQLLPFTTRFADISSVHIDPDTCSGFFKNYDMHLRF